jgi:hypothetical protein
MSLLPSSPTLIYLLFIGEEGEIREGEEGPGPTRIII